MDKDRDHKERRRPRLGHSVSFKYCRTSDDSSLCFKITDCWWEYFDVVSYLKANYDINTVQKILQTKPKSKMQSIVELIEQAKQRVKNPD